MVKKRKLSGLGSTELSLAYNALLALRASFQYEFVDEQVEGVGSADRLEEQLDGLLSLMGDRLGRSKTFSFSNVTRDILQDHLHVKQVRVICLKPDPTKRVETTSHLGRDHIWSSDNFQRHLNWLETLVPQTTEASVRPWINAFFFRVSAMVPEGMRMVLNMEHTIPATVVHSTTATALAGQIDYSAIVANEMDAIGIFADPLMSTIRGVLPTGFFVAEAKPGDLRDHIPQAVAEMYGCAKLLKKEFLRGALTNGHRWIFLILHLNPDGIGGTFKRSVDLELPVIAGLAGRSREVVKPLADLIAGVLLFWVEHSFEDLGEDDWFQIPKAEGPTK